MLLFILAWRRLSGILEANLGLGTAVCDAVGAGWDCESG
jgi:hypothetical protein